MRNSQNLMDAVVRTLREIEGAAVKVGYLSVHEDEYISFLRLASVQLSSSGQLFGPAMQTFPYMGCT